jgi:hypothetical protein
MSPRRDSQSAEGHGQLVAVPTEEGMVVMAAALIMATGKSKVDRLARCRSAAAFWGFPRPPCASSRFGGRVLEEECRGKSGGEWWGVVGSASVYVSERFALADVEPAASARSNLQHPHHQ